MPKVIHLFRSGEAIVDDDVYEYLSQWNWHLTKNGYAFRHVKIDGKEKAILMHRVIADTPEGYETDHINGNKLDNQRSNLRNASKSQNQGNSKIRTDNKTGFKGVHSSHGRYIAQIRIYGKKVSLGTFNDPIEAARAYDIAAKEHFGEFAKLNNP